MADTYAKFLIENLLYPVWLLKDGVAGIFAKGVREACYIISPDTTGYNPISKLYYYLDATATCERAGDFVFGNKTALYCTLGLATGSFHLIKNKMRDIQYNNYKSKSAADIQTLNDTQKSAFSIGVDSSKSKLSRMASWFSYSAWRAPKAYMAGFSAGRHADNRLIGKIKP